MKNRERFVKTTSKEKCTINNSTKSNWYSTTKLIKKIPLFSSLYQDLKVHCSPNFDREQFRKHLHKLLFLMSHGPICEHPLQCCPLGMFALTLSPAADVGVSREGLFYLIFCCILWYLSFSARFKCLLIFEGFLIFLRVHVFLHILAYCTTYPLGSPRRFFLVFQENWCGSRISDGDRWDPWFPTALIFGQFFFDFIEIFQTPNTVG